MAAAYQITRRLRSVWVVFLILRCGMEWGGQRVDQREIRILDPKRLLQSPLD